MWSLNDTVFGITRIRPLWLIVMSDRGKNIQELQKDKTHLNEERKMEIKQKMWNKENEIWIESKGKKKRESTKWTSTTSNQI